MSKGSIAFNTSDSRTKIALRDVYSFFCGHVSWFDFFFFHSRCLALFIANKMCKRKKKYKTNEGIKNVAEIVRSGVWCFFSASFVIIITIVQIRFAYNVVLWQIAGWLHQYRAERIINSNNKRKKKEENIITSLETFIEAIWQIGVFGSRLVWHLKSSFTASIPDQWDDYWYEGLVHIWFEFKGIQKIF